MPTRILWKEFVQFFDSCFFSGGAIPEGSFLCLAPTTEAESAKVLPVEPAGKIV